jgi:acetyl-CoA C-acetyltransferase
MVERLRAEPDATGLVSGVGMHMTKHVFGVYSATPGEVMPPDAEGVQAAVDGNLSVEVVAEHEGPATVSAYSVVHGRDGNPEWALLVCDLGAGKRTYAQVREAALCTEAETSELVGKQVELQTKSVDGPMGKARVNRATW